MQAGVLLGVVIGVLLNVLLPDIVIVVVLAIVLSFNSYKTIRKGLSKWAAETRARLAEPPGGAASGAAAQPRLELLANGLPPEVSSCGTLEIEGKRPSEDHPDSRQCPALIQAIRDDGIQFPLWAWGSLLVMCAFLVIYSLLLNGARVPCDMGRAHLHLVNPAKRYALISSIRQPLCAGRKHQCRDRAVPLLLLAALRAPRALLRQSARRLRAPEPQRLRTKAGAQLPVCARRHPVDDQDGAAAPVSFSGIEPTSWRRKRTTVAASRSRVCEAARPCESAPATAAAKLCHSQLSDSRMVPRTDRHMRGSFHSRAV